MKVVSAWLLSRSQALDYSLAELARAMTLPRPIFGKQSLGLHHCWCLAWLPSTSHQATLVPSLTKHWILSVVKIERQEPMGNYTK